VKKAVKIGLLILLPCLGWSQTNSWIDFTQRYYKFEVIADGIYRIDYAALNAAGISVATINTQRFELWGRGAEVPIYIEDGGDGFINVAGEFIEFYAEKNDGWLDTALYKNNAWQANPNYSLFNDTGTYYFTWNSSSSSARYVSQTDVNFTGYTADPYFIKEARVDYTSGYFGGGYKKAGSFNLYDPEYVQGEGWFRSAFTSQITESIATAYTYFTGPNTEIEIAVVGANVQPHQMTVTCSAPSLNSTAIYDSATVQKFNFSILSTGLSASSTVFTLSPQLTSDRNTLAYISVIYPHSYNMEDQSSYKLTIPDDPTAFTYIEYTSFDDQESSVWMYDITNKRRITVVSGAKHKALIENFGNDKFCYLVSEAEINKITALTKIGANGYFTNYSIIDPDSAYIIISNKLLYDDGTGADQVAAYKNYRDIDYNVVLAEIGELYDQFAYGIKKHPMGIRGFCEFALITWTTPPQHLLLLGKSISPSLTNSTTNYRNNLVPTYGYPPSDNLLTAGLAGTLYEPAIPTGRIAANTGVDIGDYLNKVVEFEQNTATPYNDPEQILVNKEWMKHVIHFGGGGNNGEQSQFRDYLNQYEKLIEDSLYGGFVHNTYKSSSDPVQSTVTDSIEGLINNGVSLMIFFGHASSSGFDQNIDYPDYYSNNEGKYPLLIANSCLSGDIHGPANTTTKSISEEWVIHPRGVIGFLASVSYGEPGYLHEYTRQVIKNLSLDKYGSSIGEIIKTSINTIQNSTNKLTCLEMALHGDPAIVLNSHTLPDYTITQPDVFYTPKVISTELDSFDINMVVTNIGKAINSNIAIALTRHFPITSGKTKFDTIIPFPGTKYKDTITFTLPVDIINGIGTNSFDIRIDPGFDIDELSDNNNDIVSELFIITDDVIPVYPYQYAVVPDTGFSLKASTGNAYANSDTYAFEIDTSDLFDPPLASIKIIHGGGVVEWDPATDPGLALAFNTVIDSTVFFWRVRRDSNKLADSNHVWRESSFQYIKGKRGWGQSHFFQFKNDKFNLLNYNRPTRSFDYVTTPKLLQCWTVGNSSPGAQSLENEFRIDGKFQVQGSCGPPHAIIVAVIDPVSLEPWRSNEYNFGQVNWGGGSGKCYGNGPHPAFVFHCYPNDSLQRAYLAAMLNAVPDSFYILTYSIKRPNTQQWEDVLYTAYQNLGSTEIIKGVDTLPDENPYIFFVKKGDLSTLQEVTGAYNDKIYLDALLNSNADFGYITSTIIGPSSKWGSLHWNVNELETNDDVILEVTGIAPNGTETVIATLDSIPTDSFIINNLDNDINAATYPKIKLSVYKTDDSLKTPAQLRNWLVLYDEVPEAALNPSIYSSFNSDTVNEGETVSLSIAVQNISPYNMDSLLVSYWIVDPQRNIIDVGTTRYKPLLKWPDTLLASAQYSTNGLSGTNSFWIEVNPYNITTGAPDQLEQYHFNNIAEKVFYVSKDQTNPMLDVTFDGVHILDGDIVSAKPYITIELNDENKFLVLDTNSLLQVYIKGKNDPGEDVLIPYDGQVLKFIPGSLPANKARVEYSPTFNTDGVYEMRIQARDASKNESGDIDYKISFEIVNNPTITNIMNWPNPFSTSTRFVFTLTGSEIPQDFRIRIMTITGKVVKEIFGDELGSMHIGKNITEYTWNGTDQYGDQLANGIYLYKVDVKLNGNDMEQRETEADKFFHKGYGKMYLMR